MGARRQRPVPDLDGSTLVHHSESIFVDAATGMVLTRIGSLNSYGYERVQVGGREDYVHRVVWEAIHGPIPPGVTINHDDGVKDNNHPDNLSLATQSDQRSHAYSTGLRVGNYLSGLPRQGRLADDDLKRIRLAAKGEIGTIASELGITRGYAYQIRSGRRLFLHASD